MARINALPHQTIIKGFKGTLDFYYWKGVPCVRKWPVIPMSSRSPASLAQAQIFGQIVSAWSLVGGVPKDWYNLAAADQPRTGRDLYVTGVFGHLHEHS